MHCFTLQYFSLVARLSDKGLLSSQIRSIAFTPTELNPQLSLPCINARRSCSNQYKFLLLCTVCFENLYHYLLTQIFFKNILSLLKNPPKSDSLCDNSHTLTQGRGCQGWSTNCWKRAGDGVSHSNSIAEEMSLS